MILSYLKPWSKLPVSYRVRPSPSEWYPSLSLYLKPQQHCSSPSTPSPIYPQPLWAPSCSPQTHSFRSQGPHAILCPAYGSLLQAALVSSVSPPTHLCLSLFKLIISFALNFLCTLHIHFESTLSWYWDDLIDRKQRAWFYSLDSDWRCDLSKLLTVTEPVSAVSGYCECSQ